MAKRRKAAKPKGGGGAAAARKKAMSPAARVASATGSVDVGGFVRGPTGGRPAKGR